jgi:hypothetical protein
VRFPKRLATAAAAAGLVALAGCDYWKNLVDDKTLATATLRIQVLDAWTEKPLVDVRCADGKRGIDQNSDRYGEIELLRSPTGLYSITCETEGYWPFTSNLSLPAQGRTALISMARRGGKEWYPDDLDKQVRIQDPPGALPFREIRFPSKFQMRAAPEDSLNRFRYIWKFAKATSFNRDAGSDLRDSSVYTLQNADVPKVQEGWEDTLTLIVKSRLNGNKNEYLVDSVTRPFTWVRNLRPTIRFSEYSKAPYLVGCPTSQPLRVQFTASDPDGLCMDVHFSTLKDTNSSFGRIDTSFQCNFSKPIQFPLRNVFTVLDTSAALFRSNKLYVTVKDDNSQTYQDSIVIDTKTNILPTVAAKFDSAITSAFVHEKVKVRFSVSDSDGPVQVAVDWGLGPDGFRTFDFNDFGKNRVDSSAARAYDTAGNYSVHVIVSDNCNISKNYFVGSIHIKDNALPKVALTYVRKETSGDSTYMVFQLEVTDKDVGDDADRITDVNVDWGEGPSFHDFVTVQANYLKSIRHAYAGPSARPDGKYLLSVDAHDSHGGVGRLDTLITPP